MKRMKKLAAVLTAAVMLSMQGIALPAPTVSAAPDDCHDDWLHVEGDKIVDMNGNEVWLTGVNWFGYNVGSQVFDGVWSQNMHWCLELIADHGFNLMRVPMSTEILLQWKKHGPDPMVKVNTYENPELTLDGTETGTLMYSYDIWNKAVEWCKELGIKIMIDIHCATTASNGHQIATWYDSRFSTEDWIEALEWLTETYKDDDTIIAIDLKNEPHGKPEEGEFAKWDDSKDKNNWKYAAERGAKAVLDINPNMLIMVEGIECYPDFKNGADWSTPSVDYAHYDEPSKVFGAWWGANFRGVRDYPIDLGAHQSQLVYSPHDYGPEVWKQKWFYLEDSSKTFDRESLMKDYWYDTWAFIAEEKIAPLLIGEWGGWVDDAHDKTGENRHWLREIRDYIIDRHLHHTFWCFNENSSDTGGLVYDNFGKWDDVKYEFIKPALWQDENGVFISLDHKRPIGANGQSLSEYYGGGHTPSVPKITTEPPVTTTAAPVTTVTEPVTTVVETVTAPAVTTSKAPETTPAPAIQTTEKLPQATLLGDASCNGQVAIEDAVLICRVVAEDKTATISSQGMTNADCDGVRGVSPDDATTVLKLIAKLIKPEDLKAPSAG